MRGGEGGRSSRARAHRKGEPERKVGIRGLAGGSLARASAREDRQRERGKEDEERRLGLASLSSQRWCQRRAAAARVGVWTGRQRCAVWMGLEADGTQPGLATGADRGCGGWVMRQKGRSCPSIGSSGLRRAGSAAQSGSRAFEEHLDERRRSGVVRHLDSNQELERMKLMFYH